MKAFKTLVILIILISCAHSVDLLNFNSRIYRFCDSREVKNNLGKVCFRYCKKHKMFSTKCKEYEMIIHDLNNERDYNRFLNSDFVLIKREKL